MIGPAPLKTSAKTDFWKKLKAEGFWLLLKIALMTPVSFKPKTQREFTDRSRGIARSTQQRFDTCTQEIKRDVLNYSIPFFLLGAIWQMHKYKDKPLTFEYP